jgi:hypothetical protein
MEKLENLWPDLSSETEVTPVFILKEQAANLGERTKNIVTARVDTIPMDFTENSKFTFKDKGFRYNFIIVAPALGNYTYRLFSAYNDFNSYPVYISVRENAEDAMQANGFRQCKNQNELLQHLKEIFGDPKTIKIIQTLLSQSK